MVKKCDIIVAYSLIQSCYHFSLNSIFHAYAADHRLSKIFSWKIPFVVGCLTGIFATALWTYRQDFTTFLVFFVCTLFLAVQLGCVPMGHNVSKGKSSHNEILVRDIAYLREKTQQQEKTIETLNNERELLEARTAAQTKELEKIKAENKKLKNDLKSVTTTSADNRITSDTPDSGDSAHASIEDTEPTVREAEDAVLTDGELSDTDSGVDHGTHLKIGDKVLSLHKGWSYYTATIVHFDYTTLMYTVEWDDGDPSGRVQKYCDVALDKTPSEDEIGIGTLVLFPQVRDRMS